MTDLEICQRIAEIQNANWMQAYPGTKQEFVGLISENDFCGTPPELIGEFNPLTDKALCFYLMEKYQIEVRHEFNQVGYWGKTSKINTCFFPTNINENLSRAICLAIIAKHKGDNR